MANFRFNCVESWPKAGQLRRQVSATYGVVPEWGGGGAAPAAINM
jgi:hypothetical protein